MKKGSIVMAVAALMMAPAVTGCTSKTVSSDSTFTPRGTINWTVTSSPGGGSGICTRMISDTMTKENLASGQLIIVTNKMDGSGGIGKNEVTATKGSKADYTPLTFNSGDLIPMAQNTKNHPSNFRTLAIMVVDKQLIFKRGQTKYADSKGAIKAARNGTKVAISDSKGDDIAAYGAMLEEIGISKDVMSYITYDSTGDAITAALGDHMEFVISKPVAASEYAITGSLIPVPALSTERYTNNLADTPTLGEAGDYENAEVPVWCGMAVLAAMGDVATACWSEQLGKVAETNTWENDRLEKNELIGNYIDAAGITEYVTTYEKDSMATNGIR